MMPIVFIDTETTSLGLDRRAWEIAMIRRDQDGQERTTSFFVHDIDLSNADPTALEVGRFYERHPLYRADAHGGVAHPSAGLPRDARSAFNAAREVEEWTRGASLIGSNVQFDAEVLDRMLRRHKLRPAWHYPPIDVVAIAVGWLRGHPKFPVGAAQELELPWSSEIITQLVEGIIDQNIRSAPEMKHTALGDAQWARRLYDAVSWQPLNQRVEMTVQQATSIAPSPADVARMTRRMAT